MNDDILIAVVDVGSIRVLVAMGIHEPVLLDDSILAVKGPHATSAVPHALVDARARVTEKAVFHQNVLAFVGHKPRPSRMGEGAVAHMYAIVFDVVNPRDAKGLDPDAIMASAFDEAVGDGHIFDHVKGIGGCVRPGFKLDAIPKVDVGQVVGGGVDVMDVQPGHAHRGNGLRIGHDLDPKAHAFAGAVVVGLTKKAVEFLGKSLPIQVGRFVGQLKAINLHEAIVVKKDAGLVAIAINEGHGSAAIVGEKYSRSCAPRTLEVQHALPGIPPSKQDLIAGTERLAVDLVQRLPCLVGTFSRRSIVAFRG